MYLFAIIVWLYILLCYRCGELPANVLIHFQITSNNQYMKILPQPFSSRSDHLQNENDQGWESHNLTWLSLQGMLYMMYII